MSYPDLILGHYPKRRKLSEVLNEIGDCSELADTIEKVSKECEKPGLGNSGLEDWYRPAIPD